MVSAFGGHSNDAVEPASATPGAHSCPTDEEMRRLASPEAMRGVYDRAKACYVAQLTAGRKWDEIR